MKFLSATHTLSLLLLFAATPAAAQDQSNAGEPGGQEARQQAEKQLQQRIAADQQRQQRAVDQQEKQEQQRRTAEQLRQQREAEQLQQRITADQQRQQHAAEQGKTSPMQAAQPPERPMTRQLQTHSPLQSREWQKQKGWARNGGWREHDSWQAHRSNRWNDDHRNWAQRGGYGGYYIAEDSFALNFGPGHFFRFQTRPVIFMGYPRFFYQNYSFIMVDPWPASWGVNWYDNDDVYIDFDDGYYLYNRSAPGTAIAISVIE